MTVTVSGVDVRVTMMIVVGKTRMSLVLVVVLKAMTWALTH